MPFCSVLLLAAWYIIRARYPPMLRTLQISELTREQPRMSRDQMLALSVTSSTVVAWAFWKPLGLEIYFGCSFLSPPPAQPLPPPHTPFSLGASRSTSGARLSSLVTPPPPTRGGGKRGGHAVYIIVLDVCLASRLLT